jgi:hypothetical protein
MQGRHKKWVSVVVTSSKKTDISDERIRLGTESVMVMYMASLEDTPLTGKEYNPAVRFQIHPVLNVLIL